MTNVTIKIPVIHKDNWNHYAKEGTVTISFDSANLESYERARQEANELLEKAGSEYRVFRCLQEVEKKIKSRQGELEALERSVKYATAKYQKLLNFLGRLGIDAKAYGDALTIGDTPLIEASTELVDDSDDDDSDDDDSDDDDSDDDDSDDDDSDDDDSDDDDSDDSDDDDEY